MKNLFNIGDYVILRSNCYQNRNVNTGENDVLLCPGTYSCYKDEQGTNLVVIAKPKLKAVVCKEYVNGRFVKVEKIKPMVKVISTNTNTVYEIDVDWADSYNKDEYKEALETANLLAAIGEAIQTELEEELDYEDIMSIMY